MQADAAHVLVSALAGAGVPTRRARRERVPAREVGVRARHWERAAAGARAAGFRFSALWAEARGRSLLLTVVLEYEGSYVALRTRAREGTPLSSIAGVYAAAARPERHAHDLFGLEFEGHPDPRRWTRHAAWGVDEFPLRGDFPTAGTTEAPTPADATYPFHAAQGAGVHEIPVGPVHAGVIEPGHFRFLAVGEDVLSLEERLGYVHKGIEKIAEGRDPTGLARLAARISGDSAVGHAWAACMAMERAAGITPPGRALALRGVLAEIERVINHMWDIAAICNDVAFPFPYYQLGLLVEQWRRVGAAAFGHRLLMDTVVPGGVSTEPGADASRAILDQCTVTRRELTQVWTIAQENASLHDRLASTGVLHPDDARALGAVGFVARASGQDFDVRRDAPYPPYDTLEVHAPCLPHGDVAARARVRHDECLESLRLIEALLSSLPDGELARPLPAPPEGAEGLGIVDGWRGEIVTHVRFARGGRIARFFPRDPSWLTWPTLERLIDGNIVPDFPVCNKSVNGSYSGHDL